MSVDYIIKEEYRGKKIKLPEYNKGILGFEHINNREIELNIPKNACYLAINLFEPISESQESHDDFEMDPDLVYINCKKERIDGQFFQGVDVFSLDRRLELIFEKC